MGEFPEKKIKNLFILFIMNSPANCVYLYSSLLISIFLLFIFKLFYPYPNMVVDSYVYVKAAALDMGANSFPIGYSRFLQLFHVFTHSATALVWFQYLFLESACLLFFFTLLFFFKPHRLTRLILFIFFFVNPLFLYLANFIMADTVFIALSLFWMIQLIWIIWQPRPWMILTHALLIGIVFTIRYNALYYPFFASIVILFCRLRPWLKVSAIVLQFLLIGLFVWYTRMEMKALTGINQFSPFGGWKLANDALYMYSHIYKTDHSPIPPKFRPLDSLVRSYFAVRHNLDEVGDLNSDHHGSFYMSWPLSPMHLYMNQVYGYDTIFQNFKKWGPMGAFYEQYGSWMIRSHPLDYGLYYLVPNLLRFAYPPAEIFMYLSPYHLRPDNIGEIAKSWFNLNTLTVPESYITARTTIMSFYPMCITIVHLIFLMSFLYFSLFWRHRALSREYRATIFFVGLLWLADCLFNASASGIVMRYLIFSFIIEFSFTILLSDLFYNDALVKNL